MHKVENIPPSHTWHGGKSSHPKIVNSQEVENIPLVTQGMEEKKTSQVAMAREHKQIIMVELLNHKQA